MYDLAKFQSITPAKQNRKINLYSKYRESELSSDVTYKCNDAQNYNFCHNCELAVSIHW